MPETKIIEGEVIETPKPNEIYLALFKTVNQKGEEWQISGVIYHKPDEVAPNLAAFNPKKILIVKVKIPENAS